MATILFVQPIFAPDEKQTQRNLNSIESFGKYIKENGTDGHNLVVVMGGWARKEEYWNAIVECCKKHLDASFNPIRFEKNFGKAVVVNNLVTSSEKQGVNFDYLLTADSDILFAPELKFMLGRLVVAAQQSQAFKKTPFGLIAANQKGEGCHWEVCYQNGFGYDIAINQIKITEKIVWPTHPSGIAGGCLFIGKDLWHKIGGYRVLGLYAGDDAYILLDCNSNGFNYQMCDTIYVVHPPNDDHEFNRWKKAACQRDSFAGGKKLEDVIKDADEFWESRDKK